MALKPSEIERTKLLAGSLDRASTACITVGVLAPIAAALYTPVGTSLSPWFFIIGTITWLYAALVLHLVAHSILKALDDDDS